MSGADTGDTAAIPRSAHPLAPLAQAACIRARSAGVLLAVGESRSGYFKLDREAMAPLVQRLLQQLSQRPAKAAADQAAELHTLSHQGWWRELHSDGRDRLAELDTLLAGQSPSAQLQARLDLCLLLAVLGNPATSMPEADWRYNEATPLAASALPHAQADDLLALLDQSARRGRKDAAATALSDTPSEASSSATVQPEPEPSVPEQHVPEPAVAEPPESEASESTLAAPEPAAPAPAVSEPAVPTPTAPAPAPAQSADQAANPLVGQGGQGGQRGLVLACFRAFVAGAFSDRTDDPCRVDAAALRHVDAAALRAIFQGRTDNPVAGLEARATEVARLAQLLQAGPPAAATRTAAAATDRPPARASDLLLMTGLNEASTSVTNETTDEAAAGSEAMAAPNAGALLARLVHVLAPVWAQGSKVQGLPAGDVWPHAFAGAATGAEPPDEPAAPSRNDRLHGTPGSRSLSTAGWLPLHAATLVLVQGLALPLAQAGHSLQGLGQLPVPALPSLVQAFIDAGLIQPRHARAWKAAEPSHPGTVEARAVSVLLFDELLLAVREALAQTQPQDQSELTPAALLSTLLD